MNNYNEEFNQVMQEHSSGKRKMILGIVLEGAAIFCLTMYISLYDYYTSAFTSGFIFHAICFAGVGTPFLIIGIKKKM